MHQLQNLQQQLYPNNYLFKCCLDKVPPTVSTSETGQSKSKHLLLAVLTELCQFHHSRI
jgi:hypothetical protein